jgi:hypothetical protein
MTDSSSMVTAMNPGSGGRRKRASNGIDEHHNGPSLNGEVTIEHFHREQHIIAFHHGSFVQCHDSLFDIPFGTKDGNGRIGRIGCKAVLTLGNQLHESLSGHVPGGSHRSVAEENDIRVRVLEGEPTAVKGD